MSIDLDKATHAELVAFCLNPGEFHKVKHSVAFHPLVARLDRAERQLAEAREALGRGVLNVDLVSGIKRLQEEFHKRKDITDEQARRIAEAGRAVVDRYRMVQRGVAESVELSGLMTSLEQVIKQAAAGMGEGE